MMSGRLVCGHGGAGGNLQKAGVVMRKQGKEVNWFGFLFFFISVASD